MCNPVFYGMAAGAAIGGIKGGPKGALIGGGLGAGLGGLYTLGGAAVLPGMAEFPVAYTSGMEAVAGGSGLFGGIGNFLTSPKFSLATQLVGFGFDAYGKIQQNAYARARIAYEQGVLRNRQIVAQQNIEARQLQLQVQLGIIGAKGKQARGDLVVAAAGRGVLVGQDTELDKTQQLAGDVAFQKELARHRVKLQDREDELVAVGLGADSALLDFDRAESQRTLAFGIGSTAFKTAAGFSKFRFNRSGQLEFRT